MYPKLSKSEQYECFDYMYEMIQEHKAQGFKRMQSEIAKKYPKAMKYREKLILSLTGLIVSMAKKVQIRPEKFPDVISYCLPVIDRCIFAFDTKLGYNFSSYAFLGLRGEVYKFIKNDSQWFSTKLLTELDEASTDEQPEEMHLLSNYVRSLPEKDFNLLSWYYSTYSYPVSSEIDYLVKYSIYPLESNVKAILAGIKS